MPNHVHADRAVERRVVISCISPVAYTRAVAIATRGTTDLSLAGTVGDP